MHRVRLSVAGLVLAFEERDRMVAHVTDRIEREVFLAPVVVIEALVPDPGARCQRCGDRMRLATYQCRVPHDDRGAFLLGVGVRP